MLNNVNLDVNINWKFEMQHGHLHWAPLRKSNCSVSFEELSSFGLPETKASLSLFMKHLLLFSSKVRTGLKYMGEQIFLFPYENGKQEHWSFAPVECMSRYLFVKSCVRCLWVGLGECRLHWKWETAAENLGFESSFANARAGVGLTEFF